MAQGDSSSSSSTTSSTTPIPWQHPQNIVHTFRLTKYVNTLTPTHTHTHTHTRAHTHTPTPHKHSELKCVIKHPPVPCRYVLYVCTAVLLLRACLNSGNYTH